MVVLNAALQQLSIPQSQYALPFNYLWGPQGKAISDPSFQGAEMTFAGAGLRPFAPCQLRAVRSSSGADILLSWIRRDRSPLADSWEQTEIPQSEASESYDVEILDGTGRVARTFSGTAEPAQIYTAAQMAIDDINGAERIISTSSPWIDKYNNQIVLSADGGKTFHIARAGLPNYLPHNDTMWGRGYARAMTVDPNDPSALSDTWIT